MQFLEKDLEDIIFETNNSKLREKGLYLYGDKLRQIKIGNYGISDIICFRRTSDWEDELDRNDKEYLKVNPKLEIQLLELKQNKIDANTLMQCARYCKGIKRYINNYRDKNIDIDIDLILIGREVQESGDFCYLVDLFNNVSVYNYNYDVDGIKFHRISGYSLTEEGFPNSISGERKKMKKYLQDLPF